MEVVKHVYPLRNMTESILLSCKNDEIWYIKEETKGESTRVVQSTLTTCRDLAIYNIDEEAGQVSMLETFMSNK